MDEGFTGWLFLRPEAVPEQWRGQGIPLVGLPLERMGIEELLDVYTPGLRPDEEPLAQLLAQGTSIGRIAQELEVSTRTVERRIAELRRRLGVATKGELASLLSKGRGRR